MVQRGISEPFDTIQTFDPDEGVLSFFPDLPLPVSTLQSYNALRGHWVRLDTAAEASSTVGPVIQQGGGAFWRFAGSPLPPDEPIPLKAGWNLVAYLPRDPLPLEVALAGVMTDDNLIAVLGFEDGAAKSWYASLDPSFNTLSTLRPLHGYWLNVEQDTTLVYPVSVGLSAAEETSPSR